MTAQATLTDDVTAQRIKDARAHLERVSAALQDAMARLPGLIRDLHEAERALAKALDNE